MPRSTGIPPGYAETLRQRIPELIAGLDDATATLAAVGGSIRVSGAERPSFAGLVLEGAALKHPMLCALGAAPGISGFQAPSPCTLRSCLERTIRYYSVEMTPSIARRAAEIVWKPLIGFFSRS